MVGRLCGGIGLLYRLRGNILYLRLVGLDLHRVLRV